MKFWITILFSLFIIKANGQNESNKLNLMTLEDSIFNPNIVVSLSASHSGDELFYATESQVTSYNPISRKSKLIFSVDTLMISKIEVAQSGKLAIICFDKLLILERKNDTFSLIYNYDCTPTTFISLLWNEEGNELALGCEDGSIYMLKFRKSISIHKLNMANKRTVWGLSYGTKDLIFAGLDNGEIIKYNLRNNEHNIIRSQYSKEVSSIKFIKSQNNFIASDNENLLRILETGISQLIIRNNEDLFWSIDYCENNNYYVTGSFRNGTLTFFDAHNDSILKKIYVKELISGENIDSDNESIQAIKFLLNGRYLACLTLSNWILVLKIE